MAPKRVNLSSLAFTSLTGPEPGD